MKDRDLTFMRVAQIFAMNSTCCSKKIGCCITKDDRIIATGYNGVPSGQPHCEDFWTPLIPGEMIEPGFIKDIGDVSCIDGKPIFDRDLHHQWSKDKEIHAEANTLMFCARHGISTEGATLYTTVSPCANCALLIVQAGIKKVVYQYKYDLSNGLEILEQNGIETLLPEGLFFVEQN